MITKILSRNGCFVKPFFTILNKLLFNCDIILSIKLVFFAFRRHTGCEICKKADAEASALTYAGRYSIEITFASLRTKMREVFPSV